MIFRLVPSTFSWSVWSPKLHQNLTDSFRDQLRWNTEEVQLFLFFFLPKHTFVVVVCKQNLLRTTLQLLRLNDWWQIPSRDDLHLPTQRLDSQLFHVGSASLRYVTSLESRIYYVTTPSIHRSKIQSHFSIRFWEKIRDQRRPVWSNDRWLEIWPLAKVLDSDRLDSLTKTITSVVSFLKWY